MFETGPKRGTNGKESVIGDVYCNIDSMVVQSELYVWVEVTVKENCV